MLNSDFWQGDVWKTAASFQSSQILGIPSRDKSMQGSVKVPFCILHTLFMSLLAAGFLICSAFLLGLAIVAFNDTMCFNTCFQALVVSNII